MSSFINGKYLLRDARIFVTRGPLFNFLNPDFWYIMNQSTQKRHIDRLNIDPSIEITKKHIDEGINWLLTNQELQPDDGISTDLNFKFSGVKLNSSFPEVTGYILPTLFEYARMFNSEKARNGALKASEWELTFQGDEGSFPGGRVGFLGGPSVFNTAQIVHGLVRAFKETNDDKYKEACVKACDWMVSTQEADGSWKKHNFNNISRTYDTKVAEAILQTNEIADNPKYLESARKQMSFVLLNQTENGWFYNCDNSIERNHHPLMHLIGYTLQGLLVCNEYLKDDKILRASEKSLKRLLHIFEVSKKALIGRYNSDWKPVSNSTCVTGDAQISLCWMQLFEINNDYRYLNGAFKMNDFLKSIQYKTTNVKINGSLPQSFPFWGDYGHYKINSWGVKYYLDALMQEYRLKQEQLNGQHQPQGQDQDQLAEEQA